MAGVLESQRLVAMGSGGQVPADFPRVRRRWRRCDTTVEVCTLQGCYSLAKPEQQHLLDFRRSLVRLLQPADPARG